MRQCDLIPIKDVAEQFSKSTRWVREYLIAGKRVESVNLNRKNIFVVRQSLENYLHLHTKHAFRQVGR